MIRGAKSYFATMLLTSEQGLINLDVILTSEHKSSSFYAKLPALPRAHTLCFPHVLLESVQMCNIILVLFSPFMLTVHVRIKVASGTNTFSHFSQVMNEQNEC